MLRICNDKALIILENLHLLRLRFVFIQLGVCHIAYFNLRMLAFRGYYLTMNFRVEGRVTLATFSGAR